jgi:uncharacterized membrane protein
MTAMSPALILHIGAASTGLLAGGGALVFRKGQHLHQVAGTTFFLAMLTMSVTGFWLALVAPARVSAVVAALTFYLVATSWVTVRRRPGMTGRFEIGALVMALGIVAACLLVAWVGANSPRGRIDGLPYQPIFAFMAIAGLAAVGDARAISQGGVMGPSRLARHLWRMCAALIIASLAFVAQPKAIPAALHGNPLLFLPILAAFVAMVFWLVRTLGRPRTRAAQAPTTDNPMMASPSA